MDYTVFSGGDFDKFKKYIYFSGKINIGVLYSLNVKIQKDKKFMMLFAMQEGFIVYTMNDEIFGIIYALIITRFQKRWEEYKT
jgi:hypothetical protein